MIEENKAKEYADNLYPDASPNNAPYHTTGDSWDDCRNAFIAGYEAAEKDARDRSIKALNIILGEISIDVLRGIFFRIDVDYIEQFLKHYNNE